jgi:Tfp pilus assembly major pilin PilA
LIVVIAIIAILAAILIPLLVNHVRNSRCSGEFADAKNAHNIIAEHVADVFAGTNDCGCEGSSISADCSEITSNQGWPDEASPDISTDGEISIEVTVGEHSYPASVGHTCGNSRCPVDND